MRELKEVGIATEDVLKALEEFDYELVAALRAKVKTGHLVIKKNRYKISLKFEEVEQL